MNLDTARLVFLDLQTTGATPAGGNILEIAWCTGSAVVREPEESYEFLVKQPEDRDVPRRITALTGITTEQMSAAVPFADALQRLQASLKNSDRPKSLIIHFAQFEKPFLADACEKHSDAVLQEAKILCTHQIAARLFPNLPSRGIRGLAGYFGLPLEDCKRAPTHAAATFLIWKNLCKELHARGIVDFDQLEHWLATTQPAKRTKYEYPLDKQIRLKMPDNPGIYRMLSKTGDVLYVGKATSLKSRVNSYFRGQKKRDPRKLEMLTQTWNIHYTVCDTVVQACVLEVEEIKRLSPPYNVSLNTGIRPLVFYNWNFDSAADEQSAQHPVGPFRSGIIMDPFVRLWHSLLSGEMDPLMFFDPLEQELMHAGFELFLKHHGLLREHLRSPRSLVALGLCLRRLYADSLAPEDEQAILNEAELSSVQPATGFAEEPADEPDEDDATETELTASQVADKFERLLMRSAHAYLLAKRLTLLLDADIDFMENGCMYRLHTIGGKLVSANEFQMDARAVERNTQPRTQPIRSELSPQSQPWNGLAIDTFDRLRVLQTELQRIKADGLPVTVRAVGATVKTLSDGKRKRPRAKLEGASAFS